MADPQPSTQSSEIEGNKVPHIPTEIVSDEEMAFIEAALAAARSSLSSSTHAASPPSSSSHVLSSLSPAGFRRDARSVQSITLFSKRKLSMEPSPSVDIEDAGGGSRNTQKRSRVMDSFLHRFRRKRGLSVTDVTSTEWCEKQMEFSLLFGKPEVSKAMKAGIGRRAVLLGEVIKKVEVRVRSAEDIWALKFMSFIAGVNQLMFDGLTRVLPLIGFVEGVWMVGVIDEVRMPTIETEKNPTLVDMKTRAQPTLPSEPLQRNGRLQLMCYKYMWDNLVADIFPFTQFFDFFSLNRHSILSEEIRDKNAKSGYPVETLEDLVRYYRNTCRVLPSAHDQLLLRYELQEDQSLLCEDQFKYDSDWVKGQIQCSLEFWLGEREAKYPSVKERWKCNYCQFASVCPFKTKSTSKPS